MKKQDTQNIQKEIDKLVKDTYYVMQVAQMFVAWQGFLKKHKPDWKKAAVWLLLSAFFSLPLVSLLTGNLLWVKIFGCGVTLYTMGLVAEVLTDKRKEVPTNYQPIDADINTWAEANDFIIDAREIRRNAKNKITLAQAMAMLAAARPEQYKLALAHVQSMYSFARRRKYNRLPKQAKVDFNEPAPEENDGTHHETGRIEE